jgi:cytochrome b pre-mRNA-processing protein 3
MVLERLFRPRAETLAGRALYASAAAQARSPAFYAELGAPDTAEGRFELFSLHVALLLLRLKGQGRLASETSQQLFETFVRSLDDALREMGVGDVVVGKRMRKLGEAFYGRMRACEQALAARPDLAELQALVERTVFEGKPGPGPVALAGYVARAADELDAIALEELLAGRASWPQIEA